MNFKIVVMTEAERIDFLISSLENGNGAVFGEKIGCTSSVVSRLRRGRTGIKLHIDAIINAYPRVNRTWLTTGEGHPGDITIDIVREQYERKLERAEVVIDHLTRRINELENRLASAK